MNPDDLRHLGPRTIVQSTTHSHLVALHAAGLVAWEPGSKGTLRPTVRVVAVLP